VQYGLNTNFKKILSRSSFGHLDGLNSSVRTGNQTFTVSDAHIRFERNTEAKAKNSELVEKVFFAGRGSRAYP
jgi:hypothetical protein